MKQVPVITRKLEIFDHHLYSNFNTKPNFIFKLTLKIYYLTSITVYGKMV